MKTAVIAVALFGFLLNIGRVQQKPTSLQPTKMEAFAGQPAAHVTWSKEIGKTFGVSQSHTAIDELKPHCGS